MSKRINTGDSGAVDMNRVNEIIKDTNRMYANKKFNSPSYRLAKDVTRSEITDEFNHVMFATNEGRVLTRLSTEILTSLQNAITFTLATTTSNWLQGLVTSGQSNSINNVLAVAVIFLILHLCTIIIAEWRQRGMRHIKLTDGDFITN